MESGMKMQNARLSTFTGPQGQGRGIVIQLNNYFTRLSLGPRTVLVGRVQVHLREVSSQQGSRFRIFCGFIGSQGFLGISHHQTECML